MSVWTDTLSSLGYTFNKKASKPRGKRVAKGRGGDSSGHSFKQETKSKPKKGKGKGKGK